MRVARQDEFVVAGGADLSRRPISFFKVPPSAFRPPPKVHSTVIQLTPMDQPVGAERLTKWTTYSRWRVRLFLGGANSCTTRWQTGLGMSTADVKAMTSEAGIDSERRPATLSIDEWISLTRQWQKASGKTASQVAGR